VHAVLRPRGCQLHGGTDCGRYASYPQKRSHLTREVRTGGNVSAVTPQLISPAVRRHPSAGLAAALLLGLGGVNARAQDGPTVPPHVRLAVYADRASVGPGQVFTVAIAQRIVPHWHTYWTNPGDAGQATSVRWELPAGYAADEPQWPVPEVIRAGTDVSYGYEREAIVLQQMHSLPTLAAGPARLVVEVRWLACSDVCIPEQGNAELLLRQDATASTAAGTAHAALFATARSRLPVPAPWPATLAVAQANLELRLVGAAAQVPARSPVRFLPATWGQIDHAAAQRAYRTGADLVLMIVRGDLRADPPAAIDGLLVVGAPRGDAPRRGFIVHAPAVPAVAAGASAKLDLQREENRP
jgi:DsbC/DsbD-like thiol-disulfide interchange protein